MKFQHLLPLTLLAASVAAFAAGDAHEPFQLFQLFRGQEQKVPSGGEPYTIFLNGRVVNSGVTDKLGAVVTDQRMAGTSQEFVMQLYGYPIYSFRIDANDRATNSKIGPGPASVTWDGACKRDKSNCKGKGFYWLQLMGKDTHFENEPYALVIDGQRQTGQVAEGGYIFVLKNDAPEASAPMRLHLCGGRSFDVVSGWTLSNMAVTPSAAAGEPALAGCEKSAMPHYGQKYAHLNGGAPYISTRWAKGMTPEEIVQEENRAAQDLGPDYQKIAAANNDNLAWLGAMPATWSDDEYRMRMQAVIDKITTDLSSVNDADPHKFQCKLPAQVGPVPEQEAVNNYLAAFPDSIHNAQRIGALYAAAAKGNWLATAHIFGLRLHFNPQDREDAWKFRTLQLMEWLQARKIGGLYRELGSAITGSGDFSDTANSTDKGVTGIDIYAAMHNSYPAQLAVGKKYAASKEPALQAVGKKMIACATSASSAYKRLKP